MAIHILYKSAIAAFMVATLASHANAAVVVDDDGKGFVGKGDIQLIYDWNNASLQSCVNNSSSPDSGCLSFRIATNQITESTWTCTHPTNGRTNERARTTTTSTQALVSAIARVKKQVTGFNLNGFVEGADPVTTTTTEGPSLGSCPTYWTASPVTTAELPGGDPVLEVSSDDGAIWTVLPVTPII